VKNYWLVLLDPVSPPLIKHMRIIVRLRRRLPPSIGPVVYPIAASAEKLKQPVIASISSVFVATSIPELPSIPEHHGTDKGEGHGEKLLDLEVLAESEETTTIAPAEQEETEDTCVCLPSMFDREAADWGYGRRKRLQNAFASFVFWVM
jgi:hypothetical protein